MQDREAVTRRLRRRRATGVHQAHSVPSGFTIAALDALGSGVGLRTVADSVVGLVTAEAVTSFLIRAAAGVTQVHRFGSSPYGDSSIGRSWRSRTGHRVGLNYRIRRSNRVGRVLSPSILKVLEVFCEGVQVSCRRGAMH